MTMGTPAVDVVLTPISDIATHIATIQSLKINGERILFSNSINIALLALKNRVNKIQKQRIIILISSPIRDTQEQLEDLAKKIKKSSVAVDVILVGH